MDFQTSIKTCFKKYAVFSGRSSRQEYIGFYLFIILVSFLLAIIEGLLGVFPSTYNSIFFFIFNLYIELYLKYGLTNQPV